MSSSPSVSDNCGKEAIPSFPNIEYSFYGYNILKGYPLSEGVDPGFTQPIFKTDFTSAQHTSDCRYKLFVSLFVGITVIFNAKKKVFDIRFVAFFGVEIPGNLTEGW